MLARTAAFKAASEASMSPRQLADIVFDAIRKEQFYILPHPEYTEVFQLRTDKLLRLENPVSPFAAIGKLMKPAGTYPRIYPEPGRNARKAPRWSEAHPAGMRLCP